MGGARDIPSIEQLRQRAALQERERRDGRDAVVQALRIAAEQVRARLAGDETVADPGGAIESAAVAGLDDEQRVSLRSVINATGVILHTNLGRAPLARPAAARVAELSAGYSNLEYDLQRGQRGRRDVHVERLLCRLTGAAAAAVVNNNAAATLLSLAALAAGREVLISRGELVEIGGGFRIPEVMAQSGARLREVGTTNRTRIADYAAAISERTAAILRIHPSNFRIEGFTERPSLESLVALGRRFRVPVFEDLGSGYLGFAPEVESLRDEPDVRVSVAAGVEVVMFSGDKLLGGPQSGIMVGAAAAVDRIRRHPLMRAMRTDKMTCAALEATLMEFAADRATTSVPVAAMITMSRDTLAARADALATRLMSLGVSARVLDGCSTIGGGSAPGSTLPTRVVALEHRDKTAAALEAALRARTPPVIARIEAGQVLLDLRTVAVEQDESLAGLIASAVVDT